MTLDPFYQVVIIERFGVSRILDQLSIDDLFTCACTSRTLRHLAFAIRYRELIFRLYPPLESPEAEEGRVKVIFPKRDRYICVGGHPRVEDEDLDDQDTDSEEEETFGFKLYPAAGKMRPKSVKDGDGDDMNGDDDESGDRDSSGESDTMDVDDDDASAAATDALNDMRETKVLTGVLRWFSSRMYITHYVKSLKLYLCRPQAADTSPQPVLLCDARSFLTLLHSVPRLENLWLENFLLAGDGDHTASLMADAHLAPVSLRHLCIDIAYEWLPRMTAPPQLLRELLMPFGTLDELRVRYWPDPAPVLAPLPEHLVVRGLVLEERVEMRPLLVALARHPQAHVLRRLVCAEECGWPFEGGDRDFVLAHFRVFEALGGQLEVLGVGPMNMERAARELGLHDHGGVMGEHAFRHLRADALRTIIVPVTLWEADTRSIDDPRTIWSESAYVLWMLRESAPDVAAAIRTIVVRIVAEPSASVSAFVAQIRRHRRPRRDLEVELLDWVDLPHFERVVVEFVDTSKPPCLRYAVREGPRLLFPRVHKKGVLRGQDWRMVEERWHY